MKDKDDETPHHTVRTRAFSSSRNLQLSCDPVQIYFLANTQLPYLLTMANFIHVEWTLWTGESTAQCAGPSRYIVSAAGLLVSKTFLIINFFLIAGFPLPSRLPKSLGVQEFKIFNEPPPMTVILVVLRTRWRWPNDETTPTRIDHNTDNFAIGNLMGISRYPTGLPNTDGSLLLEARQACLARSLSDGSRLRNIILTT
ncbi:hypothetical protein ALC56_05816 [Trachymyrmex septentrionalis]|uniref:Uncharacterized protein n=1 Tax=Trachymyrmex septentrionalis TaxID=34720 RepID=A0A151JXJ9_9HYME|nr:hypothetical protein ALC56_05816 [Trachymyrmex septentrionalis]